MSSQHSPMPMQSIPADTLVVFSIFNSIMEWLPGTLTVIAGVLGIAWYAVLFYDRFVKKTKVDPKQ